MNLMFVCLILIPGPHEDKVLINVNEITHIYNTTYIGSKSVVTFKDGMQRSSITVSEIFAQIKKECNHE